VGSGAIDCPPEATGSGPENAGDAVGGTGSHASRLLVQRLAELDG